MRRIKLTRGWTALVDNQDYERLSKHTWHVTILARKGVPAVGAARRSIEAGRYPDGRRRQRFVIMARVILNAPPDREVDHINRGRGRVIDNRRQNLRLATSQQNKHNQRVRRGGSSIYKGVDYHRKSRKWRAQITLNGKVTYIGIYPLETDAAYAYDAQARLHFGEFCHTNFPQQQQEVTA